MTEEQRRLTFLRENIDQLEEAKGAQETLLFALQRGSEVDSHEILRRLRSGVDVHTLSQEVHTGRLRSEGSASGENPSIPEAGRRLRLAKHLLPSFGLGRQYQIEIFIAL